MSDKNISSTESTAMASKHRGIFIFGDLHLGKENAPGLEWAKRTMDSVRAHGATVCICAGDLIHRSVTYDDPAYAEAKILMRYAVSLFNEVHFIAGNHDVHLDMMLPEGVVKHSTEPHEFECAGTIIHTAAVAADPDLRKLEFPTRVDCGESPDCGEYANVDKHTPHLGVLHTSVTGEFSKRPCLPITVDQMLGCGYDAWILAHVHTPYVLSNKPFIGWIGMGCGVIYRPDTGEIIHLN